MKPRTLLVTVLLAVACKDTGTTALDDPNAPTRSYRMGFSAFPPKFDPTTVVAVINQWSARGDAALFHESPPWQALLAGATADSAVRFQMQGIAQIYRGKNLPIFVTIDVTDGLNRAGEAPELVAAGRSITEPAVQALYRQYVAAVARIIQPEYLGLAAETNLIRLAAPRPIYDALVRMTNDAAAELQQANATSIPYVSVQVEAAWGGLQGTNQYIGVEDDFRDFPFIGALGLSSYPYFVYNDPADLPADYYERLLGGRDTPTMLVEGGWTSASVGSVQSDVQKQARYIARHALLLERAGSIAWLPLFYTDLDIAAFGPQPAGSILPLFVHLGLVDMQLSAKAALASWDSLFSLRRR
jgi:hypothetical protein